MMTAGQGDVTVLVRGIEAQVSFETLRSLFNHYQQYTYAECVRTRRLVVADLRTVSRFSARGLVELKCIDVRLADLRQARRQTRRR